MQSIIKEVFTKANRAEDLRQIYKNKLEQLSVAQKTEKSQKIQDLFKKLPFFKLHSQKSNPYQESSPSCKSRHSRESGNPVDSIFQKPKPSLHPKKPWIAIYKALKNEPDLSALEQSVLKDQLCYPVLKGDRLEFYSNPKQKWLKNRFQIEEPVEGQPIPLQEIAVFCIPGLCFDRQGGRLGKGLGYYDKTLSLFKNKKKKPASFLQTSPWFVGVAFKEQIYNEALPLKNHDIDMDLLLTDAFILAPLDTKRKGN